MPFRAGRDIQATACFTSDALTVFSHGLTFAPTFDKCWCLVDRRPLGRCVRKGERALSLCMPITVKRHRSTPIATADTPTDESDVMTWFVYTRLAWGQCLTRGLTPGPMATYPKWKALGRCVRKGERALSLCMPITVKRHRSTPIATADTPTDESDVMTWFVYTRRWFVLSQTDGDPLPAPEIPTWDGDRALEVLDVREIPFDQLDGNCLGVARDRSIAINPVNPLPHKTRFHELAHVLLGHTSEGLQADHARTPRTLRECEAESVALLCCAALALPGVDECRGYIQS